MKITYSATSKKFTRLCRGFEEIYHIMAVRSGLSDSAFLIFCAISELGEGCLQKDIADRYFMSRQTVSSSIRVLERKGYLVLRPGKRRDMHIYLTNSGRQVIEDRLGPMFALEESVFQEMPPEEREVFFHLFGKYINLYRQKLNIPSSEG